MQDVTAIVSAKGGTGKSTIVCIMSYLLAQKGKRILVVDLNSGLGTLDFIFGVKKDVFFDASDVVASRCSIFDAVIKCKENLFLLPAPLDAEQKLSTTALSWIVNTLRGKFDHIIIDCHSGIDEDILSTVFISKKAVIVTTADPVCIKCSAILGTKIHKINPNVRKRIIINRFSKKVFLRSNFFADLDEVIDASGVQLLGIIPENETIYFNCSNGVPFFEKNKALFAFEEINARFERV